MWYELLTHVNNIIKIVIYNKKKLLITFSERYISFLCRYSNK